MSLYTKFDFTFRIIVLILAVTVGVLFLFAGARNALAANLKPTVVISDDVFTVGDIFSGLSKEVAARVLGPAPQPGEDMVLNARTLMRVAIALDLPWRPSTAVDQVVIRRAATRIDSDDIREFVTGRLKQEGLSGRFNTVFTTITNPEMVLPGKHPISMEAAAFEFDPQSDRFEITIAAPSRENALSELTIAGKIERLISVPVLKSTVASGEIIDAYNIKWVDIKSSELQSDTILNEEDIIGMTPRGIAMAGKLLRKNDLQRPRLVSRGDMITISYQTGSMSLTARGKALQNGAKGDLVRVINTGSNRTIDAIVKGENLVTVVQ